MELRIFFSALVVLAWWDEAFLDIVFFDERALLEAGLFFMEILFLAIEPFLADFLDACFVGEIFFEVLLLEVIFLAMLVLFLAELFFIVFFLVRAARLLLFLLFLLLSR